MNTVGKTGSEAIIQAYVKKQGKEKEYPFFRIAATVKFFGFRNDDCSAALNDPGSAYKGLTHGGLEEIDLKR